MIAIGFKCHSCPFPATRRIYAHAAIAASKKSAPRTACATTASRRAATAIETTCLSLSLVARTRSCAIRNPRGSLRHHLPRPGNHLGNLSNIPAVCSQGWRGRGRCEFPAAGEKGDAEAGWGEVTRFGPRETLDNPLSTESGIIRGQTK